MRRLAGGVVVVVVVAAALAATGGATRPSREPALSGPVDFPAGAVCSFPVHGDVLVNRQTVTTFSDGRQLVTGAFVVRLTNVDTGKSLTINAPGSLEFTLSSDQATLSVVGRGRNVYFFFAGDLGPGASGELLLIDGLVTEQFTAAGLVGGSFTHSGSVTDLCAALAS